jgi:hypothetical protein
MPTPPLPALPPELPPEPLLEVPWDVPALDGGSAVQEIAKVVIANIVKGANQIEDRMGCMVHLSSAAAGAEVEPSHSSRAWVEDATEDMPPVPDGDDRCRGDHDGEGGCSHRAAR